MGASVGAPKPAGNQSATPILEIAAAGPGPAEDLQTVVAVAKEEWECAGSCPGPRTNAYVGETQARLGDLQSKLCALKPSGSRLTSTQCMVGRLRTRSVEQGKAVASLEQLLVKAVAENTKLISSLWSKRRPSTPCGRSPFPEMHHRRCSPRLRQGSLLKRQ